MRRPTPFNIIPIVPLTIIAAVQLYVQAAAGKDCSGKAQNYRLEITPQWDEETDKTFHNGSTIGYVIVVAHDRRYTLFAAQDYLKPAVKHLVRFNLAGPLLAQLEKLSKAEINPQIHSVTFASSAEPNRGKIQFNLKVANATSYLSFIGVLQGTPDSFFGISRFNLCRDGQFIKEFPPSAGKKNKGPKAWTLAYDAGFDARNRLAGSTVANPENRTVRRETRNTLDSQRTYATYTLEQGQFVNWKCLHGSMVVALRSGKSVRVHQLRVGDAVQSKLQVATQDTTTTFSEIYMFTHATLERAHFVNITTHTGAWLAVTPDHLVYAESGRLLRAADIRPRTVLIGHHTVVSVREFVDVGIYNPHTLHGDIVVNGFQTSSYTAAFRAPVAHSLLTPFRALWTHLRWYSNFLRDGFPSPQNLLRKCAA